jgi:hypothetical protein
MAPVRLASVVNENDGASEDQRHHTQVLALVNSASAVQDGASASVYHSTSAASAVLIQRKLLTAHDHGERRLGPLTASAAAAGTPGPAATFAVLSPSSAAAPSHVSPTTRSGSCLTPLSPASVHIPFSELDSPSASALPTIGPRQRALSPVTKIALRPVHLKYK